MSSRLYPLHQRGNPQLRVFLSNFWMKMLPPKGPSPPNLVRFIVSPQMTRYDVHQYLAKIYNVNALSVSVTECIGRFRRVRSKGYIVKDDHYKVAHVTLPSDQTFEYPDLLASKTSDRQSEEMKEIDNIRRNYSEQQSRHTERPGVPSWFQ